MQFAEVVGIFPDALSHTRTANSWKEVFYNRLHDPYVYISQQNITDFFFILGQGKPGKDGSHGPRGARGEEVKFPAIIFYFFS
jgi:hypothetical protein